MRLMRTELGGALADLLNENGKGSGDNEMGYVERTLGFRTWILDDRDLRLNSEGFNDYTRICIPIVGSRLRSLCHINLDGNRNPIFLARIASGICGNSSSLGNSQNGAGQHRLVAVIQEILMRRCGPAPVKLVTPEKHWNFVKGVLENPHSKASSKESSATDMDPEVLESSPRMLQQKRKCEEPSIPSEEDGIVESRFREQGMKPVKKAGICTADRRTEGQPHGNARNKRNFNGLSTASRNTQM
ncbi:hypothetical protein RHSIM_Rhsim03G0025600 [Rhododendron simsii]|uniref:Uncharacterized protein n=1 Tax=Rhododendron simsii TaxID=118357 RepID=A0A834LVN0_RHOSS|nr:hypothetical protein RHSIM_Rhsim03G0025600 [Rhododendron simsii]